MREWIEGLVGPDYAVPVMAGGAAIIALILLFIVWRIIRHFSAGTYVAGGRNRKTRLAVMDATAIDNHRRLVLVRRDDVEHLILIGGAADVVVERDIRLAGQVRRPTVPTEAVIEALAPEPPPRPAAARPSPPAPPPAPARPTTPAPSSVASHAARAQPPAMRPAPPPARPSPATPSRSVMPPAKSLDDDFDDELLRELEVELDADKPSPPAKAPAVSLDDEMTRLLGELSSNKR